MLPALPGKVEQTGLILPASLPFEEWADIGRKLNTARESVRWWIGDWLAFGESAYGEKYAQALDNSEWDYQTLRNFVWVARAIPHTQRRAGLSWSHHAECAAVEGERREELLEAAERNQWTVRELRENLPDQPTKPRKPKGIHIGKFLLWDDRDSGRLFLSKMDGEMMETKEDKLEQALDAFWSENFN